MSQHITRLRVAGFSQAEPWQVDEPHSDGFYRIADGALVVAWVQGKAKATLIAAAPDLLAAAEAAVATLAPLLDKLNSTNRVGVAASWVSPPLEQLRAAIARAKGEE